MSAALPFSMTPEAAEYVRAHLSRPRLGQELGLVTCLRKSEMIEGEEHIVFDGEHFMFGVYDVGQRPDAEYVDLFGHLVSIVPSTLESLRGRTLTVRRIAKHCGGSKQLEVDVLVAG